MRYVLITPLHIWASDDKDQVSGPAEILTQVSLTPKLYASFKHRPSAIKVASYGLVLCNMIIWQIQKSSGL